ncbi:unnamed protein product, partial [Polarella glacialis]
MSTVPATGSRSRADRVAREWAAAGLGCALADTIFNPLEVLKTRRQLALRAAACGEVSADATVSALAREAIRKDGLVAGLWAPGLAATWLRGMSYTGFRIGCYGSVRDLILGGSDGGGILGGLGGRLAAGAITGAVGSAIFAPTDVVRIRMQGFSPYSSTPAAFVAVVSDEGVSGLWRGAGASMLRATLLSSSQLAV